MGARRTDLLLVLLLVPAVLILVVRAGASPGVEIVPRDPSPGIDQIRVQVGGAVRDPGVVTVAPGARIADALALAGGPTSDADPNALNLARRVVDEDRVIVPRRGEAPTAGTASLIDLNRASAKELESLPGVGAVTARRILDARATLPFASSDDLVARKLVSARVYARIRDLVATPSPPVGGVLP